ncbi:GNAT family N-acetyltransferase [Halobacillus litoralis]|uniref:GNAT family N-acetyltransferase n=1 Tax=Halobacillus litoralis TaxID=45668 RepID=UPI001CD4C5CD|nr:GNAT family N-acetyltransferase [Halobacillus litoralis]MCA0972128.1 GNAT family N-acetyltransferase [Halobacillus litoralis]
MYPLFETVFDIPFSTFKDFHSRGFWDPSYKPYSYFVEGRAVANVSTFQWPILLDGNHRQAIGIQSVMTHPEYRGTGRMADLMNKAVKDIDAEGRLAFLVTSDPVLYEKFGFSVLKEYYFVKKRTHQGSGSSDLRPIDPFDVEDLGIIQRLFRNNTPSSSVFYPLNYEHSFYLNVYNPFLKELLYYSPSRDVLVMYEVLEGRLELFDVIGETLPELDEVCSWIREPFEEVHLFMSPDKFDADFEVREYSSPDCLMVRGEVNEDHLQVKLPVFAEF